MKSLTEEQLRLALVLTYEKGTLDSLDLILKFKAEGIASQELSAEAEKYLIKSRDEFISNIISGM